MRTAQAAAGLAALAFWSVAAAAPGERLPSRSAEVNYKLHCAGCHGFDGRSASNIVPDLKERAGYFLCNDAGRDYMGRLPNVVFSGLSDAEMAELMNYVVAEFGAGTAPAGARPYRAEEFAKHRHAPLSSTDLKAYRLSVVGGLIEECGAPDVLRTEYGGRAKADRPRD